MNLGEQSHAAARASLPVCSDLVQEAALASEWAGLNVLARKLMAGHKEEGTLPP